MKSKLHYNSTKPILLRYLRMSVFLIIILHHSGFTQNKPSNDIQPFTIKWTQNEINDLKLRLTQVRWPDEPKDAGWNFGANLQFMKALADYWQIKFNWEKQEALLNQFKQYTTTIQGQKLHFLVPKLSANV